MASPMQAYGPAVLRLSVGAVFILDGLEKLIGLWGGSLGPTVDVVTALGLRPAYPLAVAAAATELAAGVLLVAGAYTLWTALALTISRGLVLYQVLASASLAGGAGRQTLETSLLLIGSLVALMLTGPGAWSIDESRLRSAEREAAGRARIRAGHA